MGSSAQPTSIAGEMPAGKGDPHLPTLDGIRGLAILLVLLFHIVPVFHPQTGVWRLAYTFWCGVDLFFVLSGFLITGILLDAKGQPHYFRNFYARRVLRIFPLYYGVLAVYFFLSPLRHSPPGHWFWTVHHAQGWLWLYLQNFWVFVHKDWLPGGLNHFWSLAVEEQFYLVWPFLVFFLNRRALAILAVSLIAGALVLRLIMIDQVTWLPSIYFFTPARTDGFAAGALGALLVRSGLSITAQRRGAAAVLFLSTTLLGFLLYRDHSFLDLFTPGTRMLHFTMCALVFGGLVAFAGIADSRSLVHRALSFRPLRFLGKYSYGIYVYHFLILKFLSDPVSSWVSKQHALLSENRGWVMMPFYVVISILVAFLSWHLYEKHFLKLKKFFARPGPAAEPGEEVGKLLPQRFSEKVRETNGTEAAAVPFIPETSRRKAS